MHADPNSNLDDAILYPACLLTSKNLRRLLKKAEGSIDGLLDVAGDGTFPTAFCRRIKL